MDLGLDADHAEIKVLVEQQSPEIGQVRGIVMFSWLV